MVNPYAFGFVVVAAAAVLGADYVVQAKVNGSAPGVYAVSDYMGGFAGRARDAWAAADKARRQRVAAREHLPETVAGFERRAWERDRAADEARMAGMPFLDRQAYAAALAEADKAARAEVWEYARGGERFLLSARFEPLPEGGRKGPVTAFVAPGVDVAQARLEGFDIVRGVPFFRVVDGETGLGGDPAGPVMLQGFLGDELAIGVHAERPFAELGEVLAAIDYDSMNAMLDAPVAGVGDEARPLAEAEKATLLQALAERYGRAGAADAGRARVARATIKGGQALAGAKGVEGVKRLDVGRDGKDGKPARLTLSGGRSCLGSAGRLCD